MDILYAGDSKLRVNQHYVGADTFKTVQQPVRDYEPLLEALEDIPSVSVDHLDSLSAMEKFPSSVEKLSEYDALILSDITRGTLEPHFASEAIPGPNILKNVKKFVEQGGALIYCGGWMTFQGYQGTGNWQGTPVERVLPVKIRSVYDDRVERPEGASVTIEDVHHPISSELASEQFPDVYGYNKTDGLRPDSRSLATVDGQHLLAVREVAEGRSVVYASDPGPKWGFDLMDWTQYAEFWEQIIMWASQTE